MKEIVGDLWHEHAEGNVVAITTNGSVNKVGRAVMLRGCARQAPEHHLVSAQDGRIEIVLDEVNDGRTHFYTYKHQGKNVNFFIRTDGEGTIRAHFDACYSCFKYKLGYVQEDENFLPENNIKI